jgi:hypothetical protein
MQAVEQAITTTVTSSDTTVDLIQTPAEVLSYGGELNRHRFSKPNR